ncbi:MAG: diguanylate cyclase [Rubrivivax sp.]
MPLPPLMRRILSCLLLLLACAAAAAQPALRLGAAEPDVDAWPAVTMLSDPEGTLTFEEALASRDRFVRPAGPHANLGPRRDAVWLRVPLAPEPADDGLWVLDIDYASLDRVDVWLVSGTQVRQHALLGDHLVFAERPLATRSHALKLRLAPGEPQELLLRVQTTSSMIVPLRLAKAEVFHARESAVQMLQGIAAGIGLCLVAYALAHWAGTREPMFLFYALTVAGTTTFFFAYFGLAAQHLWPASPWPTDNMAPFAVLLALGSGMQLTVRILDVRALAPRVAKAAVGVGMVAYAVALLFLLELVPYRVAHLAGTLIGPLPMALAVPFSIIRWRQGDRGAPYLAAGWGVYAIGVAIMASLLRGWIDSNEWTQHAFQAGALFEMLMWMRVLGLRTDEARQRAELADHERRMMQALAHTDALTSLPNRRGLEAELALALAAAAPGHLLAVYLLDLDGFKAVNDQLGHEAGDELLVAVAARLKAQLRQRDTVARLGGDEFVVLVRDLPGEEPAWAVGRKLVDAFQQPFMLGGRIARVGLTVGFALAPQDGSHGAALLRQADAAMYAGKQGGRGTLRRAGATA